ncbi:conserved hypothetical protein [Culex quinquefasciatus]|uniref:Uncharacterized protein n=1 Tax=Culex quinquefasciatus TaxID=7176 RepID=B0WUB0_CULQU|nr:conserved hypothetical protein [Culex quinquefasciatus]|eukprot:XP_001870915.1 conserved hypothetical protein [Culex quinquefasciatus]
MNIEQQEAGQGTTSTDRESCRLGQYAGAAIPVRRQRVSDSILNAFTAVELAPDPVPLCAVRNPGLLQGSRCSCPAPRDTGSTQCRCEPARFRAALAIVVW